MTKYEQRVLLGMIKDCYEPSSMVAAHLNYLADAIDARNPEVRTRMVGVCIDYLGRATEKDWAPRG
jgi:hypothetical protein